MANQPGIAGRYVTASWWVSTAADAAAAGTPNAVIMPARPTADTAVPPPGIGTSDAITEMPMFSASSVQKLIDAPNASRHASSDAA